jgi:hypothetical protein
VFHSPQVSQRPAHFSVIVPQDWQTKRVVDLAKKTPGPRLAIPSSIRMAWVVL